MIRIEEYFLISGILSATEDPVQELHNHYNHGDGKHGKQSGNDIIVFCCVSEGIPISSVANKDYEKDVNGFTAPKQEEKETVAAMSIALTKMLADELDGRGSLEKAPGSEVDTDVLCLV